MSYNVLNGVVGMFAIVVSLLALRDVDFQLATRVMASFAGIAPGSIMVAYGAVVLHERQVMIRQANARRSDGYSSDGYSSDGYSSDD
jgi:hypothetical protein